MGVPSAITKTEAGARSITVDDWSALAIALNVPTTSLIAVPRITDREAWAPADANRSWAGDHLRWVEIGPGTLVDRETVHEWFGDPAAGPGRQFQIGDATEAPVPAASHPWIAGSSNFEAYMAAAPFADRVNHVTFRHPAMMSTQLTTSQVKAILAADAFPDQAGQYVSGVSRKGMAEYLRTQAEQLATNLRILADEIESGVRRGTYAPDLEQDGSDGGR